MSEGDERFKALNRVSYQEQAKHFLNAGARRREKKKGEAATELGNKK